jgi:hypothetical protein
MSKVQKALTFALVLSSLALAIPAFAGKSGGYSPSLTTSLQVSGASTAAVPAGTQYTISGCGYDATLGMVTVVVYNPVAAQWTADLPDANGCISISNFATEGSGSYKIDAWQHVRNKDQIVAENSFTL